MLRRPALPLLLGALLALAPSASAQGRITGSLDSGDATLTSGEFVDTHTVSVRRGQWIEVTMRSSSFDPYLILQPPSCTGGGACDAQFDNDDFFPDGGSFLWVEAAEAGTWEILATSYAPGDKGDYTLDVILHDDGRGPQTPGLLLDAPRSERGALQTSDGTLESGEYVDRYSFAGRAGDRVVVDLRSSEFDPYLVVNPPVGDQLDNDDWEGAQDHARIELTLPASGVYRILVTSYAPGETGTYVLVMEPGGGGGSVSDPFSK